VLLSQQQPREFFAEGIHQLAHQWDACLIALGNYFYRSLLLCPEQSPNGFHLNKPHTYVTFAFTHPLCTSQEDKKSEKVCASGVHVFSKCNFYKFIFLYEPDVHLLQIQIHFIMFFIFACAELFVWMSTKIWNLGQHTNLLLTKLVGSCGILYFSLYFFNRSVWRNLIPVETLMGGSFSAGHLILVNNSYKMTGCLNGHKFHIFIGF
jgi:hypothetical protein